MWSGVGVHEAQAAPLFAPLIAAAGIFGPLLSIGINAAITYGLSALVSAIFPPTSTTSPTSSTPTQVTYGDRVFRGGIFGSILDAGEWTYVNEFNNSTKLQLVYVLSDGWCTGLEHTVFVNGAQQDLIVNASHTNNEVERYKVDTYNDLIDIRFHDGRPGQATDTELVAQGLDANAIYANMAYVAVTVTSDSSKFNGIPSFGWVTKGLKAYDPRKDTTAGGSGSHRFNDPTTWEYTKNPAVLAYHYMRGFYFNSLLVLGAGLNSVDIDFNTAIAAMNVCDEDVTRPDGTHRARYEVNYKFDESMQYSDVLDVLCQAMGGFHGELQGRVAIWAGTAQSSVLTFTDDDLVVSEARTFDPLKQGVVLYTGIEGVYTSPKDYNSLAYSSIIDSGFATEDGDIRIWPQDYPQVQDAHQSFLLAKQQLFANRFQAVANVVLDIKDTLVQIGDWVTWNSASPLRGSRLYKVMQTQHDLSQMRMSLVLQEISASIWADTATLPDIATPTRVFDFGAYLTDVGSFTCDPATIIGSGGTQIPSLVFHYTAIFDPGVRAVDIEYRVKDIGGGTPGPTLKVTDKTLQDGVLYTTDSVAPGLLYEARGILDALAGRAVNLDPAWVTASGVTPTFAVTAVIPDNSIAMIKLVTDLENRFSSMFDPGSGGLADRVAALEQQIAEEALANLTDQLTMHTRTSLLSARTGGAQAAVIHQSKVQATATSAVASDLVDVAASLTSEIAATNDNIDNVIRQSLAEGLFQVTAQVDPNTAIAEISLQVKAQVGDAFADSGIVLQATADGLGGTSTAILLKTDKVYVYDGVHLNAALTFDPTTGAIIAGRLLSADGKFDINLTSKYIRISS